MLPNLEDRLEGYLDSTPFFARLFFGYEVDTLKDSIRESRRLRNAYEPTEMWHIDYAQNFNKGYEAAYNAADRAYAGYDAIKSLPIIGEPICSAIDNYLGSMLHQSMPKDIAQKMPQSYIGRKYHLPRRETTMKVLEDVHSMATEGICAHYEYSTGNSAESLRTQIAYTPALYIQDPAPFRGAFVNAIESLGNFFGELFG